MQLYWEYAQQERAIRGINPWHWSDVPVLSPPSFSRGAVSLGAELRQWFQWIGHNISNNRMRPVLKTDDEVQKMLTTVSPMWSVVLSQTWAVPTHQDAISNAFDPTSPLSKPAYARMAQLGAKNVRYLHWTAVGAPIPEVVEGIWDSAACDVYVSSFMAAPNAESAVVNFNWPAWLHIGNSSSNELRDMSGAELGRWLSKIISWYTKNGFDAQHRSPYRYKWRHYEIFNEPQHKMEHWPCAKACHRGACASCARAYSRIFDGVAAVLRADHPELKLHGIARGTTMDMNLTWTKEFFSASNHAAGAKPPEYASYHFCECCFTPIAGILSAAACAYD